MIKRSDVSNLQEFTSNRLLDQLNRFVTNRDHHEIRQILETTHQITIQLAQNHQAH